MFLKTLKNLHKLDYSFWSYDIKWRGTSENLSSLACFLYMWSVPNNLEKNVASFFYHNIKRNDSINFKFSGLFDKM